MKATKIRRATTVGVTALVTLIIGAGAASAATLNPQATVPLAHLGCPNGQTLDVYAIGNSGFLNHTAVGFVVGGALAPRWSEGAEAGTVTIVDGVHAGQVITYNESFAGPVGGTSRRTVAPDLTRLVGCPSLDDASQQWSGTLDQEALDFLGLPADYLGAAYTAEANRTFTVYFAPQQLAHR